MDSATLAKRQEIFIPLRGLTQKADPTHWTPVVKAKNHKCRSQPDTALAEGVKKATWAFKRIFFEHEHKLDKQPVNEKTWQKAETINNN